MKKLLLISVLALILLASAAAPLMADIPANADYKVWYRSVGGVPTWDYLPGSAFYGMPTWQYDSQYYWWRIPNLYQPDHLKFVVWEVEFNQGYVPDLWPSEVYLGAPFGSISPPNARYNPVNNSWTWSWFIGMQPDWERIYWPNYNWYVPGTPEYLMYYNYHRWFYDLWNVSKIEVATICTPIPEPSGMLVVLSGLVGLGGMALRRRR